MLNVERLRAGHELAPVGPLEVPLAAGEMATLTHAELAAPARGTKVVGVIATASTTAIAECMGPRTFPTFERLYAHRPRFLRFVPGDTMQLYTPKGGVVMLRVLSHPEGTVPQEAINSDENGER
jgi:hypothetical protein